MNVVFVVENHRIGFSVSGGRYHSLLVACGFRALGHSVSYVTQNVPPFFQEFSRYYEMPTMILTTNPMRALKDVRGAELVLGYPIDWSVKALALARELDVPCWNFILDPENLCKQHAPDVGNRMHYSKEHTKALHDSDLLLSISAYAVPFIRDWTDNENVIPLMACVNSSVADRVSVQTESGRFIAITRLTSHKRFSDLLGVVKVTGIKLDIISSHQTQQIIAKVRESGLDNLISVHSSPNDEIKFKLIKRAMAGIGASVYEGLGMPFMEFMYCGKPVVCYDYPVLKEVCGEGALYAVSASPESLVNQVEELLDEYTRLDVEIAAREVGGKYSFESMCERLKELF